MGIGDVHKLINARNEKWQTRKLVIDSINFLPNLCNLFNVANRWPSPMPWQEIVIKLFSNFSFAKVKLRDCLCVCVRIATITLNEHIAILFGR